MLVHVVKKRSASTSTGALHFLMTDAGKGVYALKALGKTDGNVAADIPLGRDREPQYEEDGFTNAVHLAEGNGVKCFRPQGKTPIARKRSGTWVE